MECDTMDLKAIGGQIQLSWAEMIIAIVVVFRSYSTLWMNHSIQFTFHFMCWNWKLHIFCCWFKWFVCIRNIRLHWIFLRNNMNAIIELSSLKKQQKRGALEIYVIRLMHQMTKKTNILQCPSFKSHIVWHTYSHKQKSPTFRNCLVNLLC